MDKVKLSTKWRPNGTKTKITRVVCGSLDMKSLVLSMHVGKEECAKRGISHPTVEIKGHLPANQAEVFSPEGRLLGVLELNCVTGLVECLSTQDVNWEWL